MAVKDSEKAAFRPILNVFLGWRLHNVQNDTDPVLVVVSDYTLVGIGSVAHDESILTNTAFGRLPAWQVENGGVWWCSISKK